MAQLKITIGKLTATPLPALQDRVTAMGTARDDRSTIVKEAKGFGITLYCGLSPKRDGHDGAVVGLRQWISTYKELLSNFDLPRYKTLIAQRGFIQEPKAGTADHELWVAVQNMLIVPSDHVHAKNEKQEWFRAHYGGKEGFDKRWMQPSPYPAKAIECTVWGVKYLQRQGELILEPAEQSYPMRCVPVNLYSQLGFGLRVPDPNLYLASNVSIALAGKAKLEQVYVSGKGTSSIFWQSLVRNAKAHPLSPIGTSGRNFAALAKSAYGAYTAAVSAEPRNTPTVPFDLGYVIGNFLTTYNPDARAGPIWMSGGDLKRQKIPLDCKGAPKVGDIVHYIIGTIVRVWKKLRLPAGGYEDLLALAPDIPDDEWLMLQSCVLVPKDEPLPMPKVAEKCRIYGIYEPGMNAIPNAFNKWLSSSVPNCLQGGHKGPGANYESKTGPHDLREVLLSPGLSILIMGDDCCIKYHDRNGNAVIMNIDYTACDFSLTAWEVYGTMMAELHSAKVPNHDDYAPLVRFLALQAVTGPTWVNGICFTRRMGMISGIGGTSDNDRRVVLARAWISLQAGGYRPNCLVEDIDTAKVQASLETFGKLKTLEVARGAMSSEFVIQNFNWISHRFHIRPDDPSEVSFLPNRDKLFAALYAHSGDVNINTDPVAKGARAIGLAIQFPEYEELFSTCRSAFQMAFPLLHSIHHSQWTSLETRLRQDFLEIDDDHLKQMVGLLKLNHEFPSREICIQKKFDGKVLMKAEHTVGYVVEAEVPDSLLPSVEEIEAVQFDAVDSLTADEMAELMRSIKPVGSAPININVEKAMNTAGLTNTRAEKPTPCTDIRAVSKPNKAQLMSVFDGKLADQLQQKRERQEKKAAKAEAKKAQEEKVAEMKRKVYESAGSMLASFEDLKSDGASNLPSKKSGAVARRPVASATQKVSFKGQTYNVREQSEAMSLALNVLHSRYDTDIFDLLQVAQTLWNERSRHNWKLDKVALERAVGRTDGEVGAFKAAWVAKKLDEQVTRFSEKLEANIVERLQPEHDEFIDEVEALADEAMAKVDQLFDAIDAQYVRGKLHGMVAQSSFYKFMLQTHRGEPEALKRIEIYVERLVDASTLRVMENLEKLREHILSQYQLVEHHIDLDAELSSSPESPIAFVDGEDAKLSNLPPLFSQTADLTQQPPPFEEEDDGAGPAALEGETESESDSSDNEEINFE